MHMHIHMGFFANEHFISFFPNKNLITLLLASHMLISDLSRVYNNY